jgi:hypothetical protein
MTKVEAVRGGPAETEVDMNAHYFLLVEQAYSLRVAARRHAARKNAAEREEMAPATYLSFIVHVPKTAGHGPQGYSKLHLSNPPLINHRSPVDLPIILHPITPEPCRTVHLLCIP